MIDCNKILNSISDNKEKESMTKYLVLIAWFDLLGKAGLMSNTPRTMPVEDLEEYALNILDSLKTIDKKLDINLIKQTLFPVNINVYTGEVRCSI